MKKHPAIKAKFTMSDIGKTQEKTAPNWGWGGYTNQKKTGRSEKPSTPEVASLLGDSTCWGGLGWPCGRQGRLDPRTRGATCLTGSRAAPNT